MVDNSGGSSNSKMESLAESASIDLDMQSDAMSECTTVRLTFSSHLICCYND